MKSAEEIMEGFDLTESYRDAAELAGCSPNTVARYVAARQAGLLVPGRGAPRPSVIDGFLPKLEELVERSKGKIRADVARVADAPTILFCFWLAWCRFRVVLPLWDKSQPSVFAAIDAALRRVGGVPTYLLTDNEKTVTTEHVAGVPVRNAATVALGRHYGLTVATCVPADPATKGGSEACVRVAKADLVPTDANLLSTYARTGPGPTT